MRPDSEEPILPYTPSNTGRRSRVGYFGLEGVGFNDLWPLFVGLILTVALALKFFVGDGATGCRWLTKTLVALLPAAMGFGYLRFLVMGRPPHFKRDVWDSLRALRFDFEDPPLGNLPLVPRFVFGDRGSGGPSRAACRKHPLLPLGRAR